MKAATDWLNDLLQREHAALLAQLAAARSPAELRSAADAALTLAGDVIAAAGDGRAAVSFRGLPFWHFPDPASFHRAWPELAGAPEAAEADLPELAAALGRRGRFVLLRGTPEAPGPVLVLDTPLVEPERLIGFLFALAMGRPAQASDTQAIAGAVPAPGPEGEQDADRIAARAEILRVILDSEEARQAGSGWTWPWR